MDFPGKNTGVGCHFLLQECVYKPIQQRAVGLGLQWESMEGSVGLLDANENGQSLFLAAKFTGNCLGGGLMTAVVCNGSDSGS